MIHDTARMGAEVIDGHKNNDKHKIDEYHP